MESECKSKVKEFVFEVKFILDDKHPLYEERDRVIRAELGILMMEAFEKDPMIGYEIEVIK
jgi:hypothetical protein